MVLNRRTGEEIQVGSAATGYKAFLPASLPPSPALQYDRALEDLRDRANRAIGRLDGVSEILPGTDLFLYQYVRKEAVLSSQIEGTQSSLSDLLLFEMDEAPGVPRDDVEEVSNYVTALNHGLKRLENGFPLSLRLLREMHAILLQGARGKKKLPGEFRRSQVWVGGTTPANAAFVPPPPERLAECLGKFEEFLHADSSIPVLIKAALVHVQFETIHPFLDGNGRLGRLLITLLLCHEGVLAQPVLYLSLYLKQHRQEYYEWLQKVRLEGDWEGWIRFFLTGIRDVAMQAVDNGREMLALFEADRELIRSQGRVSGSMLQIHEHMQRNPLYTTNQAATALDLSPTTVRNASARLIDLNIVHELTGQQRYQVFAYSQYLKRLGEGT